MLSIAHLGKTFEDGTRALSDVSLEVGKGEFVVVLGPSGSGKTTLLRCINGLVTPSTGTVELEGRRVAKDSLRQVRGRIGMIFQDFNLVGNLTALNNVLTGVLDRTATMASLLYLFNKEHKLWALECLDRVGILAKAYTRADRLSGGQQQRVGIARAIIKKPAVLLADEPVASLDPLIAFNILSLLKDINRTHGITVVCNLHQVDFALRFADRIVGLAGGGIVMDRPTDEVDEGYIQDIYRGHDQGLFFGPGADQARPEEDLRFTA
ncbi:MAG: phosphonate ABC transporter ATP-binding protein [Rhodospirillales bacterium]|jgi:phosphonate transport system ATP-binding protein|nr:phosphonate ABC transporter ATP-binding protein [Rhodospirillales bacterium]